MLSGGFRRRRAEEVCRQKWPRRDRRDRMSAAQRWEVACYLPGMPSVQAYAESREGAIAVVEGMVAAAINSMREPGDESRTKLNFILVDVDETGMPIGLSE